MNVKFIISVVVLFVLSLGLGFVVHGTLLSEHYSQLPNLYRTMEDSENYFGFMLAAHLSIAIGLTWIYRMGHEAGKPWLAQGVKFGLAIAVVSTIPIYLIYYAVQPAPQALMTMQIAYDVPAVVIMGIVTALLNK
ncbi:MAG: hypothetical protein R3212_10885 [Xanthomonadales bacterium]|nr:hypothetical protein [Xanthomonadales bacterium]